MKRFHGNSLARCRAALLAAAGLIAGCCNDVTDTQCFNWEESTTCPGPEVAATMFGYAGSDTGEVTSAGTFWPAHDYRINGALVTEPAVCCYETVVEVCTRELH